MSPIVKVRTGGPALMSTRKNNVYYNHYGQYSERDVC